MLAARQLEEAHYAPTQLPEPLKDLPVVHPEAKSGPKLKPRFYKFVTIGIVGSIFCSGLYFSSLAMEVIDKGYQINNLKNEIGSLEIGNERLRLEIAQMDSLERVEGLALAELGMKRPEATDYLLLPIGEQGVEEENAAQVSKMVALEHEEVLGLDDLSVFQKKAAAFFTMALEGKPLDKGEI